MLSKNVLYFIKFESKLGLLTSRQNRLKERLYYICVLPEENPNIIFLMLSTGAPVHAVVPCDASVPPRAQDPPSRRLHPFLPTVTKRSSQVL